MKRLKIKKHLKINTVFVREPMKLLNDRSDMFYGSGSGNDTGS